MSQSFLDLQDLQILFFCPSRKKLPKDLISVKEHSPLLLLLAKKKWTNPRALFIASCRWGCPLVLSLSPKTFSCVLTHHTIFREYKKSSSMQTRPHAGKDHSVPSTQDRGLHSSYDQSIDTQNTDWEIFHCFGKQNSSNSISRRMLTCRLLSYAHRQEWPAKPPTEGRIFRA